MATANVCVIIGAGTGLGAGLARQFAQANHAIVLVRRDAGVAQQMAEELQRQGAEVYVREADVREPDQVQTLFDDIETTVGTIDVVIFNVGGNMRASILETSAEDFERMWRTNTFAGFLVGQAAARVMVTRQRGTILFSGATASLRGGNGFAAFASAKNGLRALAQSMARELGPQGVHVAHVVIDGGIDSPRIRSTQPERVENAGEDGLLKTDSIALTYVQLHQQPRDAWAFELDLRPWRERW